MQNKIICHLEYFNNKVSLDNNKMTLDNYQNNFIFDEFKKKIIKCAIKKRANKIKLLINNEEVIEFYITFINNIYLVEVYNNIDNKMYYIETLNTRKSNESPKIGPQKWKILA